MSGGWLAPGTMSGPMLRRNGFDSTQDASAGDSILDGVTSINDEQLQFRMYGSMSGGWLAPGTMSGPMLRRNGFDSTQDVSAGDSILDGVTSINDERLFPGVCGALSGERVVPGTLSGPMLRRNGFDSIQDASAGDSILDG